MLNYTQKPHKLKKALCTFIFLFFNAQNYSCCSKISKRFTRESQMGTRESQNGHSGLLKWLVSLVISKLALLPILRLPLAHLRLPHEPFLKFSSQQEKFFSSKKEKNKRTKYYFRTLGYFFIGQRNCPFLFLNTYIILYCELSFILMIWFR